jgi:hypothetical protein
MKGYARLFCGFCISLLTLSLHAQDFEDFVSKYTGANGEGFMQPLANAFGANLNSGWFHNAYIMDNGFQLYLGLTAMSAVIPQSSKTFTATTEGFFNPVQTVKAPTIFGSSESTVIQGDGGTAYAFPGGLDMDNLPLAVPNLALGSIWGTNVSLRWAAYDLGEDIGEISLFGWGIRHKIDQYIPVQPVNMALGFYMQQFTLGDWVDADGWLASLQASYQLRFVTLYSYLGFERSNLDVQYTYEADDSEIAFDLKGDNSLRFALGLTVNLGPLKVHGDYNMAKQSLFTLGVGIGINETEKMGE